MSNSSTNDLPSDSQRVFRIGLTGGIASGKSVVADMFAELGVPIIDTDVIAREVVARGEPALQQIGAEFGAGVLNTAGELDRAALRERIFDNAAERQRLESILHPLIRQAALDQSAAADGAYQVIVVPLLFESGFDALVDRTLVVDCPAERQRERLAARDGSDPEQIDRILASQLDRDQRRARADDLVDNGGDLARTRAQVEALHERYTQQALG